MRTHRFGKKIKLPATIAIKRQLIKLMFEEAVKEAEKVKLKEDEATCRSSEVRQTMG